MSKRAMEPRPKAESVGFSGELTIQRIGEIKDDLARAMDRVDALLINIAESTEVDISFLQLLCSAHRSALNLNKELSLADQTQQRIRKTLKDAGFVRHVGCSLGCSESCFWVMD